jgi:hypothetical protein
MVRPVMIVSHYPDGGIDILDAPEEIVVAERFLSYCMPPYASYGDGILTVHARNGDVSYGLHHYDPLRRQWRGTRS